jgi:polysaccharide export outer membrane protein
LSANAAASHLTFFEAGKARSYRGLRALWIAALIPLAACSGLPADGPTASDIVSGASPDSSQAGGYHYPVVDVDLNIVQTLRLAAPPTLSDIFGDTASDSEDKIKVGDYVGLTIWEAGGAALFSGAPANSSADLGTAAQSSTIPVQVVASDGTVMIPYAGHVSIKGLTLSQAQDAIERRLHGKTAEPQVLVAVVHNLSNQVNVSGDAVRGTLVPLAPNSDRVLDAIAAAGGVQNPSDQTRVQITRNNQSASADLQNVETDPRDNIKLHPGDTVLVSHNPQTFTVLGATGKNDNIAFGYNHLSLAQALALSGGLRDERADPAGVFVFRFEQDVVAAKICGGCQISKDGGQTPVVFRLDMTQPVGFFAAQSFAMADHDVVYVANAPKVELQKFLAMLRDLTSPILTGAVVDRAVSK